MIFIGHKPSSILESRLACLLPLDITPLCFLLGNFPTKVEVIRFRLHPDYPRLDMTGDFFGSAAPE
jgi:hypothetical protein